MPTAQQLIGGVYRLEEAVGQGGMGTIWRARHEQLGRACAVKFLRPVEGPDPAALSERFLREAKLVASIQSRFVVSIFDFGTTADGELFMVMELLEGRTLAARMAGNCAMLLRDTVRQIELVLSGLATVHEAGIVHRDLKPDNIFLVEDADGCFPKILDFGISRPVGRPGHKQRALTRAGLTMGTPHYMAPEQIRGETDIDGRADLYTLGALLFKACTGRFPIVAGNVMELMVRVVSETPPRADLLRPEIGAALGAVIARSLDRDRNARFATAREMRQALEAARASIPAACESLWERLDSDSGGVVMPLDAELDTPAFVASAKDLSETPPEAFAGTLAMSSGSAFRG